MTYDPPEPPSEEVCEEVLDEHGRQKDLSSFICSCESCSCFDRQLRSHCSNILTSEEWEQRADQEYQNFRGNEVST